MNTLIAVNKIGAPPIVNHNRTAGTGNEDDSSQLTRESRAATYCRQVKQDSYEDGDRNNSSDVRKYSADSKDREFAELAALGAEDYDDNIEEEIVSEASKSASAYNTSKSDLLEKLNMSMSMSQSQSSIGDNPSISGRLSAITMARLDAKQSGYSLSDEEDGFTKPRL